MTISANVRKELFEVTSAESKLIRIKPTEAKAGTTVYSSKQAQPLKMWTQEEHEKFLQAMERFPAGPWKVIAAFIGTKTTRQTMTHAQKYRQKISRWRRGLRHKGRKHAEDGESNSDNEYSANKDKLFQAIEYVSGDDGGNQYENGGNQLFRLAELASIEVMKDGPQSVQNLPSPGAQENSYAAANAPLGSRAFAPPSHEWRKSDGRMHPSEQMLGQRMAAYQPQGYGVHMRSDEDAGCAFRLPPLIMQGNGAPAIPPLRSRMQPRMLGHSNAII